MDRRHRPTKDTANSYEAENYLEVLKDKRMANFNADYKDGVHTSPVPVSYSLVILHRVWTYLHVLSSVRFSSC
jgi:hypothetical protein